MSSLEKKVLLSKLPSKPPIGFPFVEPGGSSGKRGMMRKRDFTPVSWDHYFQNMHDVKVSDGNTFRVYTCGDTGPVVFFLHGGGFSALSWALVSSNLCKLVRCQCAAVDLRGHGDSVTDDEENLSAETLSSDVGDVIKHLYGDEPPPIILVGHSMGGAVSVHTAHRDLVSSLVGLVVIDVVEGTALEALTSMQSFLRGRPPVFKSLEYAIEWCVKTGQIRNIESAKVSMVGQLKRLDTDETATSELEQNLNGASVSNSDTITEEDENETETKRNKTNSTLQQPTSVAPQQSSQKYTWRIDLSKTEKFWRGWFEGLSQLYLSCPVPKLLLLAGVDRLDKDLAIGQMQGKFQLQCLRDVGHALHEDSPDKVAEVLATFLLRHKYTEAKEDFTRIYPAC